MLPEITWPATLALLRIPIMADPAGLSVSAKEITLEDGVEKFETVLFEIVSANAPETEIPVICTLVELELFTMLSIILLLIVEADAEEIAV